MQHRVDGEPPVLLTMDEFIKLKVSIYNVLRECPGYDNTPMEAFISLLVHTMVELAYGARLSEPQVLTLVSNAWKRQHAR